MKDSTTIRTNRIKTYTISTAGWNEAKASMVTPAEPTNAIVKLVVTNLNAKIYVDKFQFSSP